jgi:hypothetical protein
MLHLLAGPLHLEHTHPFSAAHTSIPFPAPPTCTPPTQLGLAPSPPPPVRIVSICRLTTLPRNASSAPIVPASPQADIKEHAHAHYDPRTAREENRHMSEPLHLDRDSPSEARHACRISTHTRYSRWPGSSAQAPYTGHRNPPQMSARRPARAARTSNPGCARGKKASRAHGQNRKQKKKR